MKKQYSNPSSKQSTKKKAPVNQKHARKPLISALEPRLLLDGAAVATAVDVLTDSQLHDASQTDASQQDSDASVVIAPTEVRAVDPSLNNGKKEVVFIEDNVADYQTLIDGIGAGVEVVLLDSTQDGLAQMALWAESNSDYDAIHIISHGAEGQVNLGGFSLDNITVNTRSADLAQLGAALNEDGDLLLYGCEVASGEGQDFITALAQATQADVAASDDLTGAAVKGGDWELEALIGSVTTESVVNAVSATSFSGILADATLTFESGTGSFSGEDTTAMTFTESTTSAAFTFTAKLDDGTDDIVKLGSDYGQAYNGAESVYFGVGDQVETATMTIQSGGVFDLISLKLSNQGSGPSGGDDTFDITTSKGGSFTTEIIAVDSEALTLITLPTTADFQGITWFSISPHTGNAAYLEIDDIVLTNISFASNTAPTITGAPTDITVDEDTASNVDLSGVTFADSDGDNLTVTLTASAGTLAASSGGGVTVSNSGTGVLTLSGSAADINSYLDTTSNVQYTGASNASGDNAATLSIKANDGTTDSSISTVNIDITAVNDEPTLSIADASQVEGNNSYNYMTFTVTLSAASDQTVTVNWSTGDGTATSGTDYANNGDVLTFAPGETSKTFDILLGYDTDFEPDETFTITLSDASNATIADDSAIGTIINDDPNPNPPVINNLDGDTRAWSNGIYTFLDDFNGSIGIATVTSVDNNWDGGSLVIQRTATGSTANGAWAGDKFDFNSIYYTATATDATSGTLKFYTQAAGQSFASYTNVNGVLTITFNANATSEMVGWIFSGISYQNDTPAGDVSIGFTLTDGSGASTTATTTVTSDTIYVTNTTDTSVIDVTDGISFSEAVAIAAADTTGTQTIVLGSALAGQTITLAGNIAINESLVIDADAASGVTFTGSTITVALEQTLAINNGSGDTATLASIIAGEGNLAKTGDGRLTLSGSNSYEGTTTVTGGTLAISAASNISTNEVFLSGDVTFATAGNTLTLGNIFTIADDTTVTFNQTGSGHLTLSGQVAGGAVGGLLIKSGGGNMTLANNEELGANVQINNGTLNAKASVDSLGYGTVTLAGGTLAFSDAGTFGNAITVSADATISHSANVTLSGEISGSGDLIKSGTGVLTLSGDSANYSGNIFLNQGVIIAAHNNALGNTTGSTTVASGTTLRIGDGLALAENLTISGVGINAAYGALKINEGSGSATLTGDITLAADSLIGAFNAGDSLTLSGVISGDFDLTKVGSGTLTLSGANTHSGAVTVSQGTLALSGGSSIGDSSAVTVSSGATLSLTGGDETIGSLSGSGAVALSYGLIVGNASSTVFSGVISSTNSSGITKVGSGSLTLSGANTYTGSTIVNAGTLYLENGSAIADSSAVTINSGAEIELYISDETIGSLAGAGTLTLNGGSLTVGGNNSDTIFSGQIQDGGNSGGLIKTGSGTLTLTAGDGINTYSGGTSVDSGTLAISRASHLGTGSVTLGDGTLQLLSGGNLSSSNPMTNTTVLTGDSTINVASGVYAKWSSVISGSGSLTKTGTGSLSVTEANTYTGDTTLSEGAIIIDSATATLGGADAGNGNAYGTLTIQSGAHLDFNYGATIANDLVIGGVGVGYGAIQAGFSGTDVTFTGAVTLSSDTLVDPGNITLEFSGGISDGGNGYTLTNAWNGTVKLSGAATNWTGGISTAANHTGKFSITDASNIGSGEITLNGGSLIIADATTLSNAVTIGSGGGSIDASNAVTLSGVLSGTDAFTKLGAGTLTLSGTNIHSGAVTVSAGTLALSGGSSIGDDSAVTVNSGATLSLTEGNETIGSLSGSGAIALTYGLTVGNASNTTFSGAISSTNTSGITKVGTGTLTLSGVNTYTGSTMVSAGTLVVTGGSAIADTSAVTVASGATFGLDVDASETVGSIAGAGTISANGGILTVGGDNTSTTFSGVISEEVNGLALDKVGSGTLTLSGNNTYSGDTRVSGGVLSVADDSNLGYGTLTLNSGTLSVTGDGANIDNAISLSFNGGVVNVDTGVEATLSGVISGSGSLTKSSAGEGRLTLSGTNTYTGATTINGGTLSVTGTMNGSGAGVVTVNAGTLEGSGIINSAVTVNDGAILSAGVAANTGTLTINGNLFLDENSTLSATLSGASDYDKVVVNGSVELNNAQLTLSGDYVVPAAAEAQSFELLSNDGSDAISGTFASLSSGATKTFNGVDLTSAYDGSTGNDFLLTGPEAASVTDVSATTDDGHYKVGDTIAITLAFSKVVTVDATNGTPQLTLETGTTDRVANYTSGSGSNTLTFTYTIQEGDTSSDLDYISTAALSLNGGTIKNGTDDAILTLPTPNSSGSLAANKAIVIDTTAPDAPGAPDLKASDDTGSSNSDNVTSNTSGSFRVAGSNGDIITLYDTDGTTVLGTGTVSSGYVDISVTGLASGEHTLTAKATDAAGNVSVASSGLTVTIDTSAPTLTSSTPADDAVNIVVSSDLSLTFSEALIKGTGTIALINVTTGETVETFDIASSNAVSLSGSTLTINPTDDLEEATAYAIQIANTALLDSAGNTFAGIGDNTTLSFTTGVTDSAAPTFLSIQRTSDAVITGSTTSFTLTFNEAVDVTAADFALETTGSVAGTIDSISGSGTNSITVNVTGVSGVGSLGLNLATGHAVKDLAGNILATVEPADDEVYTVDTVSPTLISINRVDSATTNADSVQFIAVFSETVTGLGVDDFELTGTAVSGASISSVTGTGNGFVITVVGVTGDGTLGVQLKSAATVNDIAGNALTATTPSVVLETYTIENIAPTATAIITTNTALSTADSVTFDVTFSEAVTHVSMDDFEISGDVTGTISAVSGSGSSYTVTVSNIVGDGALGLNFKSDQNITDIAGNTLAGTEPTTDESYTIDNTLPTVASISRGMVNQVVAGTATDVVFTVVFNETVSGLATGDFAVTGNAANTGVSSVSSADGKVFTVTVSGVNGSIGQTVGLSFTGSVNDTVNQASAAQFTAGDHYTIAGTLLNEGALSQEQLDAIVDLNREGTLLEQSVADAKQVIIIDSRVPGLVEVTKQANPEADIWLLDGSRSATEQITEILSNYSDLDALHILSHGGVGEIYLGAETVSAEAINQNSATYAAWGNALSDSGDILLYGCNVAQGDMGIAFINQLAQVTGGDIAASDDLTGSAVLGGDWELERSVGSVETTMLSNESYSSVLANETFDFDSGVTGLGTNTVTAVGTNATFLITAKDKTLTDADDNGIAINGGSIATGDGSAPFETQVTFTIDDGKTFDLSQITLASWDEAETIVLTSSKGSATFTIDGSGALSILNVAEHANAAFFQGISSFTITEETPSETNDGLFIVFDDMVVTNIMAASDTTAPVFETSTPYTTNISSTTFDLTVDINEAGKVYYVVVADGAQAPTAAEVKAGVSYGDNNGRGATVITSGNATVSNGAFSNTFNVSGLDANTTYNIYVVAEDDEGTPNLQSSVTKVDVTTISSPNQAPIISDAVSNQTVNDNATLSPFSSVTLMDADDDNVSITVALDSVAKGAFTAASLIASGFTDAGSGSYTLTSTTLASAQAALRALVFDPADNRVAVGLTESTTFTITVNDGTTNGIDSTTTVVSTSINDAPTDIALSDTTYGHSEGATNVVVGSFSATDADTGESFTYALVSGSGDTDNAKFTIDGNDLRVTNRADVPAGTYNIRVQVNDGDATFEKSFSITVSDDIAPTISAVVPADNATGVSVADPIQVTFDEGVQLGSSGTITLYDITGNGANSLTIDVNNHNGQLSIVGNKLTINPTNNLMATNQYAIQITAGALTDSSDNALAAISDIISYNFTTGTVDTTAPTVAIVDIADPTQPNAGTVTINFSEQVTNVDISDFTLTKDGSPVSLSGLTVEGSGSAYMLNLSSVTTAEGIYVLTLNTSDITDTSGNALSAGDSETFIIDTTAPTGVAIVRAGAETQSGSAATFTAVFSEAVSGVDAADFTLTGTAAGGSITSVTQVSDSVYTITVNGVSSDGTLGVNLKDSGTGITDKAGNAISAGVTGQQVTIDNSGPNVVAINRDGALLTSADSTTFTVTFDEAVTGVDVSDFSLSGGATGTVASITGSGRTYQVTVNNISGDGSLRLDLKSSGTSITDVVGNAITTGFTSGDTLTIDNTAPVVTPSQAFNLDEGMVADTVIGQVKATDTNGVSQFSIQSGNDSGYFAIDNNGVVTLTSEGAAAIDYETATSYTLNIVATDAVGQISSAAAVTISINDVNDNAPVFSSAATATLAENTAETTVVYDANATDADGTLAHNSVIYSLKATGDHDAFTIDTATGEVKLKAAADYETKSSYSFTVIASDGMRSTEQAVTLSITDVNEAPVMTSGATGSVNENAAINTVIYTATATDVDANDSLTYSLTGDDADKLNINATTGEVTLKASADFETKSSYRFNVVATDNGTGSLTGTQAVVVNINDVNEAPVMTSGATGSVNENAAINTVIYTATATDVDANDSLTYSLTGDDADKLNINVTTGEVTLKASADFETKSSYRFNVVVTDNGASNLNSGNLSVSQAVVVSINDLNDNAPTVSAGAATATLVEAGGANNTNAGTNSASITLTKGDVDTVGVVGYDDAFLTNNGWTTTDNGQTYSRTGTYGTATITTSTDVIRYVLNNNAANTQSLTTGQSVTDSFTIQITDGNATGVTTAVFEIDGVNDAPIVSGTVANMSGTSGQIFTPVTLPANLFSDLDANDQLVWSIENLPTGLVFNAATRTISGTPQGGFEGVNTLQVVATDIDGAQVRVSFTLTLNPAPVTAPASPVVDVTPVVSVQTTGFTAPDVTTTSSALPTGVVETSGGSRGFTEVIASVGVSQAQPVAEAPVNNTPNAGQAAGSNTVVVSESRVAVNVGADGRVQVSEASGVSTNTTGLTVATIVPQGERVSITIADTSTVARYSGTLADGTQLPDWVEINPTTGEVTMTPPPGQGTITLKVNAVDADGNVRILEIEVDLESLSQTAPADTVTDITSVYMSLDDQLSVAAEQYDDYGSSLMKLLVS
jgi:autotransporter-associated beta strand protein/VCBS repeat-containing protein